MASLIDLRQSCGPFRAVLRGDTMVISFPKQLLRSKYTNFFKRVEIDPRDSELYRDHLHKILTFANQITQRLD